ncbi:MAG: 5-formyltetrahydrofolate cyclo-ligase [Oscillospiraceae bacterium]|nr:5-formyltetrahydrofolate cyclo-ligase [Oscillospiraceae bacterium]
MQIASIKTELRKTVCHEIDSLTSEYIQHSNSGIFSNITSLEEFISARCIMLFYSIGREPDTLKIADAAFEAGKTVAFPFCFHGGTMEARVISSLSEMKPAILGIPAPTESKVILPPDEIDFILVPALTYDKSRYRLGYGGGYYDRYLENNAAFTAGICRHRLIREEVPKEPHDIAVKCLVTEEKIFAGR